MANSPSALIESLRDRPAWPEGWFRYSIALYNARKWNEAELGFRRLVALNPVAAAAHHCLGSCLLQQGRWAEAAAHESLAVALTPMWPQAHRFLGRALYSLEKWVDAEIALATALSQEPAQIDSLFYLGLTRLRLGRPEDAETNFRNCLEREPSNFAAMRNLGISLLHQGRFEEALVTFNTIPEGDAESARSADSRHACLAWIARGWRPADGIPQHIEDRSDDTRIIVFLRHLIDLDHLTPIAHRWAMGPGRHIVVILCHPNMSTHDFRVEFLHARPRISVIHLRDTVVGLRPASAAQVLNRLIPDGRQGIVVYTHGQCPMIPILARICRQRRISMMAIPHGEVPWFGSRQRSVAEGTEKDSRTDLTSFDFVALSSEMQRPLLKLRSPDLADVQHVEVLGSARYCPEWLGVFSGICPNPPLPQDETRSRIVFFLKKRFLVHWPEVINAIHAAMAIPHVHVAVQPHPRNEEADPNDPSIRELEEIARLRGGPNGPWDPSSTMTLLAPELPGASLVLWGNVFVSLITSVTYQAVMLKKPVLELSYACPSRSTIAEYLPECDMRNRNDLVASLTRLSQRVGGAAENRFYERSRWNKFVDELITAGGSQVLDRYDALLETAIVSRKLSISSVADEKRQAGRVP